MEADIRYQNVLLYAVIENMHDALFIYDKAGNITSMNAQAREMYQKDFTDGITFEHVLDGFLGYDLEHHALPLENYPTRRAIKGETVRNERMIIETAYSSRIIEVNATPIVNAKDQILAIVVSHHDITELIQKQQAIGENIIQLQQQNKVLNRQAKLLDLSNEAIFAWYMDGPIIYWNQGAEKMYGYTDDDAIGCVPHRLLNSHFPLHYNDLKAILLKTVPGGDLSITQQRMAGFLSLRRVCKSLKMNLGSILCLRQTGMSPIESKPRRQSKNHDGT